MGSMGSSLPMAIGAALAEPGAMVVSISGDGGFQLNMQELQTIVHHRLNVKIILLNNGCYGMVRQFQKQYFKSRFQSTQIGYSCPNFLSVVSAYNIPVLKVRKSFQLKKSLTKFLALPGPCFFEVALPREAEVTPKLSVGQPIENQDPPLTPSERKMLNG
jgi:acetolactate synthase-1/2/3 large subunit